MNHSLPHQCHSRHWGSERTNNRQGNILAAPELWAVQKLAGTHALVHYTALCFWSQQAWLSWDENSQLNIRRGCLRSWAVSILRDLYSQMESVVWVQLVPPGGRCCAGTLEGPFQYLTPVSHLSSQTLWGAYSVHMRPYMSSFLPTAIAYCNDVLQGQKIGTFGSFSKSTSVVHS